jgi:hypothetical protein
MLVNRRTETTRYFIPESRVQAEKMGDTKKKNRRPNAHPLRGQVHRTDNGNETGVLLDEPRVSRTSARPQPPVSHRPAAINRVQSSLATIWRAQPRQAASIQRSVSINGIASTDGTSARNLAGDPASIFTSVCRTKAGLMRTSSSCPVRSLAFARISRSV